MTNKVKRTKTSKDLAMALGLTNADAVEWEVRHSITQKIIDTVDKKSLTVTEVAKNAGTSRARITKILKGDSLGISIDVLIKVVASLGQKIKIDFKKVA